MKFSRLLKLSRPKFWLYTAGPFLLGCVAAVQATPALWPKSLIGFLWFLFVGNLFVYGVNDLADEDTDALNTKKDDQDEVRIITQEKKMLARLLWICALSGLLFFLLSATAGLYTLAFLFFSWAYSALPIRAKARPFLDGIFNVLYVLPAGVALSVGSIPFSWSYLIAGTLWCMAMHAISAIPDIIPDAKARLRTTAVVLGRNGTLLYVSTCYLFAIGILSKQPTSTPVLLSMGLLEMYAAVSLFLFFKKRIDVAHVYPFYPILNTLSGMALFFAMLFR